MMYTLILTLCFYIVYDCYLYIVFCDLTAFILLCVDGEDLCAKIKAVWPCKTKLVTEWFYYFAYIISMIFSLYLYFFVVEWWN